MQTRPRRKRRTLRRAWRQIRYRRIPYWTLVGLVGTIAFASWNSTLRAADEALTDWGETAHVPVAIARIEPGETITEANITWRELPLGLLAGEPSPDPAGRAATDLILTDEVVAEERLGAPGADGTAALVPTGALGIAVPLDDTIPPLDVGDRVELLANMAELSESTEDAPVGNRSVTSGTIVAVHEHSVTVAVPAQNAGPAASAVAYGAATLALRP